MKIFARIKRLVAYAARSAQLNIGVAVPRLLPVLSVIDVQQYSLFQTCGIEGAPTVEERRTADGKEFLCAKPSDVQSWFVAVAVPDSNIDILADEVDMTQRCAHAQIDCRILGGKPAKPVHQPFSRKIGGRAHREHAGVLAAQQSLGPVGDSVERVAHCCKIASTGLGNDEPLTLAIEEFSASSALTWWLTAPWVTQSSSAARVKLSNS